MHLPIPRWPLASLATALLASCGGGTPAAYVTSVSIPEAPPAATTTLEASVQELALKVSGQTRRITITNIGSEEAQSLGLITSGLPTDTHLSMTTCGATLAPGDSCRFFYAPGATATAAPGDLAPTTAVIEIAGSNTNTVSVNLSVIDYGSVYQGGYVFAIDDSTPNTASIGGKVAALNDIADVSSWGGPGPMAGTNENSPVNCQGAVEGACNTGLLAAQLQQAATAANACATSTAGGVSGWYLPAICEMGFDQSGGSAGFCGTQAAPLLADNMQSRLMGSGDPASLSSKTYFSSTSWSGNFFGQIAFAYAFASPSGAAAHVDKVSASGAVRCVRALTP